jgi:hypothetical protein
MCGGEDFKPLSVAELHNVQLQDMDGRKTREKKKGF